MGKSSPHGTVRRCACAFHGSSVRKVRNIFRASRLRIPSKISAKDGAQSILKKATPGTWEYDAVPLNPHGYVGNRLIEAVLAGSGGEQGEPRLAPTPVLAQGLQYGQHQS